MNSTSLDINVSETLANKTLIVTTILVTSCISEPLRAEFWVLRDAAQAVLCFVSANSAVSVAVMATDRTPKQA